jgi:hypothetical protein
MTITGAPNAMPGHLQRVGYDVGQVLDFRDLVVVGQDHRAALGFERPDFGNEVRRGDPRRFALHVRSP